MNIDYSKTVNNTAQIAITVEPQDYKELFENEVKKQQKKINIKGFRKGKTPKSMIHKMYGLSILSDIVTNKLQQSLAEYLDQEKIDILGQPIPVESGDPIKFEVGKDLDYKFEFELGLKPEFDLPDLSEPFHYYDAVIEEESIDTEIESLRRRGGHQEEVKSDFEKEDRISFNGLELEEGEIKQNGLEIAFDTLVESMTDEFKSKVLDRKVGDEFDHNIYEVEKDLSEEGVRKYLMELDEEDADREVNSEFRLEIVKASRQVLAELDEEFLTMAFGDEVKTEEDARKVIRDDLKKGFDQQADNLMFQKVHDKLMEDTEIELPAEFLKRWLRFNQENSQNGESPATEEEIEERYDSQFKDSLRWQLISEKLADKYEVSVEQDEVLDELGNRIRQYLPGQQLDNQVYNQILQSLAKDEQQVQQAFNQIRTNKIFYGLKDDLTLDKEEISQKEFNEKLVEMSKNQQEQESEGAAPTEAELEEE